ncbi:MAG: flagellar hook-basal body complex protein [Butyricicoccus sp.]|nr:flagellar hook-basal body complex protein [Butyricicoccus sp.]
MTGSMYAAIAGLKTHMQNLNVIGNNIANVNTQGYKSSRAVFKTSIYTTLSGGSNGTTVAGGRNPSQIGYGANVANVGIDMSTGNYNVTGNSTDLMLDGAGFFMVGDKDVANNFKGDATDTSTLKSLDLTRVGDLGIKADGYLCNGDGRPVYGFLVIGIWGDKNNPMTEAPEGTKQGTPRYSDQLVPIRTPVVYPSTAEADPNADPNADDDAGGATTIEIGWPSADLHGVPDGTGSGNNGHLLDFGSYVDTATGKIIDSTYERANLTGITIDQDTGIITALCGDRGNQEITIGCIAIGTVTNPNGVTNLGSNYYKASEGSGELRVSLGNGAAERIGISHINHSLYKKPDNQQQGDEDTTEYFDSLRIRDTDTSMISNGLESSKTDLAQEIANMIVTQRGYQANTRIITVTDSMLEELVNMKR